MRISVAALVKGSVLAGGVAGSQMLRSFIAAVPPSSPVCGPVFLDFATIELASGSFLRESVIAFKAFSRSIQATWYPVVANASDATIEELEIVCSVRSDTILTCKLEESGQIKEVRLAGSLDAKQREAFEFVILSGGATAKQLMEATAAASERATSPTAWNNRLSALVDKRIVAEANLGRQKLYIPVLKEGAHGN